MSGVRANTYLCNLIPVELRSGFSSVSGESDSVMRFMRTFRDYPSPLREHIAKALENTIKKCVDPRFTVTCGINGDYLMLIVTPKEPHYTHIFSMETLQTSQVDRDQTAIFTRYEFRNQLRQLTGQNRPVQWMPEFSAQQQAREELWMACFKASKEYRQWFRGGMGEGGGFWHRHELDGQFRAREFVNKMTFKNYPHDTSPRSWDGMKRTLLQHLDRVEVGTIWNSKGRLYDHSYDTYLLKAILSCPAVLNLLGIASAELSAKCKTTTVAERTVMRDFIIEKLKASCPAPAPTQNSP